MRILFAVAVCATLAACPCVLAQNPTRAAAPPLNRPEANSPAQAGRNALYKYLDDVAAKDEAARRSSIEAITTREQAEARQKEVRAKILSLMGGLPDKTPLDAQILGTTQMKGFRIEKVLFESQPKFYVTALLYVPDGASGKLPAITIAPGHGPTGKAGDYYFASTLARNGFVVLSYDPIGEGERLQYPDPAHPAPQRASSPGTPYPVQSLAQRPTGEHAEAGLQPTLIGDAVARYFAWDAIRAVDYLASRPEVDAERIGAFGCSGGGTITALVGALDPRVKAIGTACYITSFDKLLPSIGPQDAEQSIPNFIASGFDLPDWVELAAPRAYAMIGTTGDMFPWAGFLSSAREARRFYSLFDPAAEGKPTGNPAPPTPTGPTMNPDTSSEIPPASPFQVIAGIGGHGNLRPLTAQIVSFFLVNLAHSNAQPVVPAAAEPASRTDLGHPNAEVPPGALQVTQTGQVLSSYPGAATVHTLVLRDATHKLPKKRPRLKSAQLATAVRELTHAEAKYGALPGTPMFAGGEQRHTGYNLLRVNLPTEPSSSGSPGITLEASVAVHSEAGRHPAVLLLTREPLSTQPADSPDRATFDRLAAAGNVVVAITPRPSPPGNEETKASIQGRFYLTEVRAELVGRTLLGMRVDDVVQALNYLDSRNDVDPERITAQASGHMGLVLLHAAVLDPRLKHITVDHVLESYRSLLAAPMPIDAPEDILPGVLLRYDIPDLVRAVGKKRLTASNWLPGTANLSGH